MEIGGACAEGGPYVPVQPCPDGAPLALIGGIFGLFGAAGLMIWFGSRLGSGYVSLVFLGWPALFISLGFNFLQYGFNPPFGQGVEWGFVVPGVMFWIMGIVPLLIGIAGWRAARSGRTTVARRPSTGSSVASRCRRTGSSSPRTRSVPRGRRPPSRRGAWPRATRRPARPTTWTRRWSTGSSGSRASMPRVPERRGVRRREGANPRERSSSADDRPDAARPRGVDPRCDRGRDPARRRRLGRDQLAGVDATNPWSRTARRRSGRGR